MIKEYQLKAAFLFNFVRFVDWPAGKFVPDTAPIVIGVWMTDPFASELQNVTHKRKIRGRDIEVRVLTSLEHTAAAHLVFIPASETARLEEVVRTCHRHQVLTVGESAEFESAGGAINFLIVDNKLRFAINGQASAAAELKLSAQLLKLATAVRL